MADIYLDFETYSSVDLPKAGVYAYVESDDFEILMMAYAIGDAPVSVVIGHDECATTLELLGVGDGDTVTVAHNAQFERVVTSTAYGMSVGEYLSPKTFLDTQAIAGEKGYPQSLENLAKFLGGEQKDTAGTRLINLFCKPNSKGVRTYAKDKPEDWRKFVEYCRQDVETLRYVRKALGDFPTEHEKRVYEADQLINDRGMPVDMDLVNAASQAALENGEANGERVMELTGITNPNSNPQMLKWLRGSGLNITSLQAAVIETTLQGDLEPLTREVLELRQGLALVASKKYTAIQRGVSADGRLRGGFKFFGAHTGRWAGRGVQLHNLPRAALASEDLVEAAILDLKLGLGADDQTLKALVRPSFQAPMTVIDYAAIEARVLAWLAGEQWALDAFAAGRDIYVETANRMGPTYDRRQGKVAVLALGYNGGEGSLRAMGAEGTSRHLQSLVTQWRGSNRHIVSLWKELGEAFVTGGPVGDLLYVEVDGDTRIIRLPSGRGLYYHGFKLVWEETQYGPKKTLSFRDPKAAHGFRSRTYGGKLTENVTQAVARDLLAAALVELEDRGYAVIGHVHDEVLVEGYDLEGASAAMVAAPEWAAGLPLAVAGFTTERYRKD